MKIFLKVKAWQLFILLVALPVGIRYVLWTKQEAWDFVMRCEVEPLVALVYLGLLFGWFWVLGTQINMKVPIDIKPKVRLFKFSVIYSAIELELFISLYAYLSASYSVPGYIVYVVMPFHALAMFCLFYSLYFISKNLVMAERKKQVKFNDVDVLIILLFFYPVGMWFIQPRINRLFQNEFDQRKESC
jgi:hypothetical protein